MCPIIKANLKNSPIIFAFEGLIEEPREAFSVTYKCKKSKRILGLSLSSLKSVIDSHIGVPVYPLWSVLIKNNVIQKAGYYLVRCKDGYSHYCHFEYDGKNLVVQGQGLTSDATVAESIMIEIFIQEIVDDLKLGKQLSFSPVKSRISNMNMAVSLIFGVGFFISTEYINFDNINLSVFGYEFNSSKADLNEQYAAAKIRHKLAKNKYISTWPNDALTLHKIFEVLDVGHSPTTYGKFEKWGDNISFAVKANNDSLENIAKTIKGVDGDIIVSISILN